METGLKESGRAEYPNGWIIKSYRHMNIPKSDFRETEKLFNEVHKNNQEVHQYSEITYGNDDRMPITILLNV